MSADRANKLWAENRQNVMSCFVETISDVVKTEALLITHPVETINHVFSTVSKSNEAKTLSVSSACSSSSSPPAVPSEGVASFNSYGYTSSLIVFDEWNTRYNCVAHITLINSLCGSYRTEIFRLCPRVLPRQDQLGHTGIMHDALASSSPTSSTASLEEALRSEAAAKSFCEQHGFALSQDGLRVAADTMGNGCSSDASSITAERQSNPAVTQSTAINSTSIQVDPSAVQRLLLTTCGIFICMISWKISWSAKLSHVTQLLYDGQMGAR